MPIPKFGEIWDADLDPVKGYEQGGFRPVLIVSSNNFNDVPHGLCIGVPITRTDRSIRSHIRIQAGDGGLATASLIMCEQVRSLSVSRLKRRRGIASSTIRQLVAERVASYLADRGD